jgi:hypothetical protein
MLGYGLDFIPGFPEGDEANYHWSTRLPKGGHQWLLDFMAEYNIPNKAIALRKIVEFTVRFFPQVVGEQGGEASAKMSATSLAMKATSMYRERQHIHTQIIDLLTKAAESEHPPTTAALTSAAKELADAYNFNWPPPDLPLVTTDRRAKRVLEKVKAMIVEQGSRISLNALNARTRMKAGELKEVLHRLEEHGYITLETEQISGPPTLWINIDLAHAASDLFKIPMR